jgi:hypothetical protein
VLEEAAHRIVARKERERETERGKFVKDKILPSKAYPQ